MIRPPVSGPSRKLQTSCHLQRYTSTGSGTVARSPKKVVGERFFFAKRQVKERKKRLSKVPFRRAVIGCGGWRVAQPGQGKAACNVCCAACWAACTSSHGLMRLDFSQLFQRLACCSTVVCTVAASGNRAAPGYLYLYLYLDLDLEPGPGTWTWSHCSLQDDCQSIPQPS